MFSEQMYVAGSIVVEGTVSVGRLCQVDHLPMTSGSGTPPPVVFVANADQARALTAERLPDIAGLVLVSELTSLATQRQIPTLQLKTSSEMHGWPMLTLVRLSCQGDEGRLILLGNKGL